MSSETLSIAPILNASPLRLVPFCSHHLSEDYVAWLNNPDVVRYSEQRHRKHTRQTCADYLAGFRDGPDLIWAIETADEGHIGNITTAINIPNRLADIAILLGCDRARGRGYGRLAWQRVLDYLLNRPDLDKITGGCLSNNVAMRKILQGCMQPDGIREAHYLCDGERVDILYFARTAIHANNEC